MVERCALDAIRAAILPRLAAAKPLPMVVGICGCQGSGKSTLAAELAWVLEREGITTAILSLDDLYLTRVERLALAATNHPLFVTRGPPGTHDIALGLSVIAAVERGEAVALPRFDKASDDRLPAALWPVAPAGIRVLLLEGWCVGALPRGEADLATPVNALEGLEDPQGLWRTHANRALAGEYQHLFARIDLLVLLAAPGFEVVARWRLEQEEALRRSAPGFATMDEAAIERFVAHYEGLTRAILAEMPARADITLRVDARRRVIAIDRKG